MSKAALLTIHGFGRTDQNYADEIFGELRQRLGAAAGELHLGSIYYQGILQVNEDLVWERVGPGLRWDDLRKFLLFGFADAAGLEANKDRDDSPYTEAQVIVAAALYEARRALGGDGPVVLLAQSLGGQVLSNYFWDAQKYRPSPLANPVRVGLWQDPQRFAARIAGKPALDATEIEFLRGTPLRALFTTGCNIPIFVAAHSRVQILPIDRPNPAFKWHNYYDRDDVLGWPLADLSPQYGALVDDHPMNAGDGFLGWVLKSWNPLSHGEYWGDDDVLHPLEELLAALLA